MTKVIFVFAGVFVGAVVYELIIVDEWFGPEREIVTEMVCCIVESFCFV